jgi:hypothetical protein
MCTPKSSIVLLSSNFSTLVHHLHEGDPVMVVGLCKCRERATAANLLRHTVDDEASRPARS